MIEILRKSYVALLVLFLALAAQIPHAAYVAYAAPYLGLPVQPQNNLWLWLAAWMLAYAYAIGVELLTLIFVVHGRRAASYGFAVASFLINLCYYAMHGVDLWAWAAFPAWLLSALNPVAIASYSHILAGAQDEALHWPQWLQHLRNRATPAIADATLSPTPMQAPLAEAEPMQGDATGDMQAGDEEAQAPLHVDPKERARQLRSEGLSNNAIAKELQVNPSTVGRWLKEVA